MKRILGSTRKAVQAQSTVEYLIFLAVVLAVLIAFAGPWGVIHSTLNGTVSGAANHWRDVALSLFK